MFEEIYGDMVSIDELCEMLTIGKNTDYHLLKTNQIKAFKIGRIWKIPRESVAEYVDTQRIAVTHFDKKKQ